MKYDCIIEEILNSPVYDIREDGSIWTTKRKNGTIGTEWRRAEVAKRKQLICHNGTWITADRVIYRKFIGVLSSNSRIVHKDGNPKNKHPANLKQISFYSHNGIDKKCTVCKKIKSLYEFNKKSNSGDHLQPHCRECGRERARVRYKNNPQGHIKSVKENSIAYRKRARDYVLSFLRTHFCVDCGESDPIVLEFDHLKDKNENISKLIGQGANLVKIQKEIDKCVVRCANCHRRKTARDFKWNKTMDVSPNGMVPHS